jgi:hypothetical protein
MEDIEHRARAQRYCRDEELKVGASSGDRVVVLVRA